MKVAGFYVIFFGTNLTDILLVCFFFQAEDGIRDYKVTGVQTCALPICGVWVTATRPAVDDAVKRNVFARSLKREVRAPRELGAELERQLEAAALDALGIAHKSGRGAIGFGRTETALAAAPPAPARPLAAGAAPAGGRQE